MAAALTVLATIAGAATFIALWSYSPGLALLAAPLVSSCATLLVATLGMALRRPRRHGIANYSSAVI